MKSGFIFRPTTSRSFERVSVKFFKGILFKRPIDSTKIARRKKIFPYILSNISHLYEGRIYFSSNISILRKKKGRDYLSLSIKRYKIIRSIVILRNIYLQGKRNLFKQRIDSTKRKKKYFFTFYLRYFSYEERIYFSPNDISILRKSIHEIFPFERRKLEEKAGEA